MTTRMLSSIIIVAILLPISLCHNFTSLDDVIKDARVIAHNFMRNKTVNAVLPAGCVFGINLQGHNIWTEGFGSQDIENDIDTNKLSVWRLADISKSLCSALAAQLVDRGLIQWDDSIHEYLTETDFPRKSFNGQPVDITIRQLLSHTAGLRSTELSGSGSALFEALNVTQTLQHLNKESLLFKPGTNISYSDDGYQVMGAIIETVLNNSYHSEISKMMAKLNLKSIVPETPDKLFKHAPRYYKKNSYSMRPLNHLERAGVADELWSYEGWWPSRAMLANVDDLLQFGNHMIQAYHGNNSDFLSQKSVKELWTSETKGMQLSEQWSASDFGMGWLMTNVSDLIPDYPYHWVVAHWGDTYGTNTWLGLLPDQHVVGAAFANVGQTLGTHQVLLAVAKNLKPFLVKPNEKSII